MHKILDKKRPVNPDKTSLPGLGDGELNARGKRMSSKLRKAQSKRITPKTTVDTNVLLPII